MQYTNITTNTRITATVCWATFLIMSKDEFIDFVYTMHLQNTNGRETHDEMFKLGIESAYKEMTGFIAFISIEESLPERNKYVLVKTPFCKYPAAVAYWNGIDWIDTTDKCKIMNVEWWRPLNVA